MLHHLLKTPSLIQSLRASPLGAHLDSFSSLLLELGYTTGIAQWQIRLTARFGWWLAERGLQVTDLNEGLAELFAREPGNRRCLRRGLAATLHRFAEHLREKGVIGPAPDNPQKSALAALDGRYGVHLREERALAASTAEYYRWHARRFVAERFGEGPLLLHELAEPDISGFVLRQARSMSPGTAKRLVTALRSFLRFLLQEGEIGADLAASVPSVAHWRLSAVPRYLEMEEVERLLAACDRSCPAGRRDYALLLLLARLGLRAGEAASLELGDIDWRAGEVRIRGKGGVHHRLPLPPDVGEALAAYLSKGRPQCGSRRVFVRMRAPLRGFARSASVGSVVRQALKRAGLQPPVRGAHLLRHSLATGLLRRGASMAEIAEVLRHQSAATTEIYAKVDLNGLRTLALPWPGNGGEQ